MRRSSRTLHSSAASGSKRDSGPGLRRLMGKWCATRTRDEVVAIFEAAEAAVGPVFDMSDIANDPHYAARNMIQFVGATPMQGLIAALSKTPGVLRDEGRALDADRDEIAKNGWLKQ